MSSLLPYFVTGIATGSIYGLAGVGLVLTYRTSGIFNFGHGATAAAAAFAFYTLHQQHHMAWPLAAAITIVGFGVVAGLLMERITRGLRHAPEVVAIMATVGILLGLEGYLNLQYGAVTRNFRQFLPTSGFTVENVNVAWSQVIALAIGLAGAFGLYVFLRYSQLGVAMRAVVDDPTLVRLTGQRPTVVRASAWVIGSSFAALSGLLLAPILNLDAQLLAFVVVQAFAACAIGLFKSLPATYAGGIVVGLLAALTTKFFTHPPLDGIPTAVPFLVLIAVLLLVPASRLPSLRSARPISVSRIAPLRGRSLVALVPMAAGLLIVPAVVGTKLPVWTSGLTYVVLFASLSLLVWTSGQISLCHASFAAIGAVGMAHFDRHVPWPLALVMAGLVAVPVGAVVALTAIRLSGIYLALVTLAFGILMQYVAYRTSWMFGSALVVTASRPRMGFINGRNDKWLYYVVLAVVAAACAALVAVQRSRLGRLLRAMAEAPTMLATNGLAVNMTRLIVFSLSAFFAAVAGALAITQTGAAGGVSYGPIQSLIFLAVLVICGRSLLRSSILAAGLFAVVPGYVSRFGVDQQLLAFGVAAIVGSLVIANTTTILGWFSIAASEGSERLRRGPSAERSRGSGRALASASVRNAAPPSEAT